MQQQPPGLLVDLGNGRARLHRGRHQALADEIELHAMRGFREGLLDLGGIAIAHRADDVVGRVRPDRGRAGLDGFQGIHHRGQHLVADLDRLRRALCQHARGRNDRRDRLAGKAYNLMGEQPARRHRHRRAVGPLEDRECRQCADVILHQILAGEHGFDARHGGRRAGVDRLDLRMRMRRAQHMEPERAVVQLVVDELSLPGDQPKIFQALDGLSRTKTHIAGKNIHKSGPPSVWQAFSGSVAQKPIRHLKPNRGSLVHLSTLPPIGRS